MDPDPGIEKKCRTGSATLAFRASTNANFSYHLIQAGFEAYSFQDFGSRPRNRKNAGQDPQPWLFELLFIQLKLPFD